MTNPAHVKPPPIPLIKQTCNSKSDKYIVKIKLRRCLTSSTPDLYEFKRSLFDHGGPGEFLLFIRNFNMTIEATGKLETDEKIHYLCTLLYG